MLEQLHDYNSMWLSQIELTVIMVIRKGARVIFFSLAFYESNPKIFKFWYIFFSGEERFIPIQ